MKTYKSEDFRSHSADRDLALRAQLGRREPRRAGDVGGHLPSIMQSSHEAVFVDLSPEAGQGRGVVAQLVKCMYGTRDAAQEWEGTYLAARGHGAQEGQSDAVRLLALDPMCVHYCPWRRFHCYRRRRRREVV